MALTGAHTRSEAPANDRLPAEMSSGTLDAPAVAVAPALAVQPVLVAVTDTTPDCATLLKLQATVKPTADGAESMTELGVLSTTMAVIALVTAVPVNGAVLISSADEAYAYSPMGDASATVSRPEVNQPSRSSLMLAAVWLTNVSVAVLMRSFAMHDSAPALTPPGAALATVKDTCNSEIAVPVTAASAVPEDLPVTAKLSVPAVAVFAVGALNLESDT